MNLLKWASTFILVGVGLILLTKCGPQNTKNNPSQPTSENKKKEEQKVRLSPQESSTFSLNFVHASDKPILKTLEIPLVLIRDETRIIPITSNFPGKIEEVYVDGIDSIVKQGRPSLKFQAQSL